MSGEVIVLGDTNVDMVIHLPDRTKQPLDLSGSFPQLSGGGTGGNTAAALARLGMNVAFVGSVGDDGFGRWLVDDFAQMGINLRGLRRFPDAFTVQVMVIVEPDGERLLVVYPHEGGAHALLRISDLDAELMSGAAWLHTTGIGLRPGEFRDTMLYGMQQARQAGIPVSHDLNLRLEMWGWGKGFREATQAAIERSDVVFGSGRDEIVSAAREIYGASVDSPQDAARILSDGKRVIVARLGAEGALAVTPDGVIHSPAFATTVVNSVGAGDAFDAGFISARVRGQDIAAALRRGNAVAALKIRRDGARNQPDLAEVEELLND